MRKDNTNTYRTPYSKIQHFRDFTNKEKWEKEELGDIERSYFDNEHEHDELPNKYKYKYNKVTHKYDDNTKEEIKGRKKQINQDFPEPKKKPLKVVDDAINPNHFFKNNTDVVYSVKLKSFEAFVMSGHDPQIPQLNRNLDDSNFEIEDDIYECGCCDDCCGEPGCYCCDDCTCDDYNDDGDDDYWTCK